MIGAFIGALRATLIRDEVLAQDRAGELGRYTFHMDGVPLPSAHQPALPTVLAEASLHVGAPAGQVVLEDHQPQAVQTEGREEVVKCAYRT
jgi:hypothetical protein